ncbi:HEPN domain-containing protein [Bradyrhizobium oligotrophicum]|uniref:HEPN domain-containing protein n=1 Tax=Bradyrhizobium TaxID=374 RepID=UPI003EB90978
MNLSRDQPDIPDDIVGPERTFLQMFKLYVEPELKRRQLIDSLPDPFTVVAAQVLFFEGRSPEVRLNDEVKISLAVKVPRELKEGEVIPLHEIQHIESAELDLADADAGHFTVMLFNNEWRMFFDFRRNKLTASNLIKRSEQFCDTAAYALSQSYFGPAIDNLFSACELVAKARLITAAVVNNDTKTHGTIHSGINRWSKLGNVDREFVEMFNKLSQDRNSARYSATDDLSALINSDMIAKARAEIDALKVRLKRFGDHE